MAVVLASSSAALRVGAFSRPQRPSRSALVVRATAATEEKVEAKGEAAVEQQTAAPAPPAQKAAPQASAAPSVRRPHSQATKFGERLPTDPLGEAGAGPLPPPPREPPTLRQAMSLNSPPTPPPPSAEVMAFNGSLPEINNGRLAMVRWLRVPPLHFVEVLLRTAAARSAALRRTLPAPVSCCWPPELAGSRPPPSARRCRSHIRHHSAL